MAPQPDRREIVVIDGALALIAVLLIVQIWLLSATLESYLGGHVGVVLPAALVSIAICGVCLVLATFIRRTER